ncbi:MAG: ATP-dependent helicase, partial [Thiobacillus sp.]|nr:ATP-dependent helicase [Thiobacillus sp.]
EPGAADVPAYQSRPPRPDRHAERSAEHRELRAKPAAPRTTLFDSPYEPTDAPSAESTPALVRPAPKKQMAALFRSPVKPDSAGQ